MPEEINRMVTDSITDFFFVTEKSAIQNLIREGKPESQIYFVGNVMIDNLYHQLKQLDNGFTSQYHSHKKGNFIFLTLHRPSNVDRKKSPGNCRRPESNCREDTHTLSGASQNEKYA